MQCDAAAAAARKLSPAGVLTSSASSSSVSGKSSWARAGGPIRKARGRASLSMFLVIPRRIGSVGDHVE